MTNTAWCPLLSRHLERLLVCIVSGMVLEPRLGRALSVLIADLWPMSSLRFRGENSGVDPGVELIRLLLDGLDNFNEVVVNIILFTRNLGMVVGLVVETND